MSTFLEFKTVLVFNFKFCLTLRYVAEYKNCSDHALQVYVIHVHTFVGRALVPFKYKSNFTLYMFGRTGAGAAHLVASSQGKSQYRQNQRDQE